MSTPFLSQGFERGALRARGRRGASGFFSPSAWLPVPSENAALAATSPQLRALRRRFPPTFNIPAGPPTHHDSCVSAAALGSRPPDIPRIAMSRMLVNWYQCPVSRLGTPRGCFTRIGFNDGSMTLQCLRKNVETNNHVRGASGAFWTAKLMLHPTSPTPKRSHPRRTFDVVEGSHKLAMVHHPPRHLFTPFALEAFDGIFAASMAGKEILQEHGPANHAPGSSTAALPAVSWLRNQTCGMLFLNYMAVVGRYVGSPRDVPRFTICHCIDPNVRFGHDVCHNKFVHAVRCND